MHSSLLHFPVNCCRNSNLGPPPSSLLEPFCHPSCETIAKIRERTRQAMLRVEVVDKLKEARARQISKPVEPGVR
ncbi:hypothetical protein VOLCADRAFT_116616, partial [Volvox carteri f. nagariensis]